MIDAHQHYWQPDRGDYGWLKQGSSLDRVFGPTDLKPILAKSGVRETIAVQAAPTVAETDYLLGLAHRHDSIIGVIGWIDLEARDSVDQVIEREYNPLFLGIRPMLQDLADRDWILKPELTLALRAVAGAQLVFDALINTDQLQVISNLAARHPDLSIVLDHAGKPPFGNSDAMDRWRVDIGHLASHPNVACKLSGLMTELPAGADIGNVNRCIDALIELFAPDRLIWGSDWPVATLVISYDAWLERCQQRIQILTPADIGKVFEGNAQRIYLDRSPRSTH